MGTQRNENRRNYQREFAHLAEGLQGRAPSLLLHSCCAPCSSAVVEQLSRYFRVTVFFYNPNIAPDGEYWRRAREQERFLRELPTARPVSFVLGDYEPDVFYRASRGLEGAPEGGARCRRCFSVRLAKTARLAKRVGADFFCTTLTISPRKDAAQINQIGEALADWYGVPWLPSDFKKKNGFLRSTELSRQYGLYRQDYCGCVFSHKGASLGSAKE